MTSKLTGEGAEEAVPKKHCNFQLLTATFEPRHENKSCSACRERMRECESERVMFEHRHENKSC